MRGLNSCVLAKEQTRAHQIFSRLRNDTLTVQRPCFRATRGSYHRFHTTRTSFVTNQDIFSKPSSYTLFTGSFENRYVQIPTLALSSRQRSHLHTTTSQKHLSASSPLSKEAARVNDDNAQEDAILYERQAEIEERELWQAQVDEAREHAKYIPAATWDGLEIVGGEAEWDNGKMFESFPNPHRLESPEEITVATYRAIVEIFTIMESGKELTMPKEYKVGPLLDESVMVRVTVVENPASQNDCSVRLEYPDTRLESLIFERATGYPTNSRELEQPKFEEELPLIGEASREGKARVKLDYTMESLRLQIASWGHSWHKIALTDPRVKLALIKRVMKLAGFKIADPVIHQADTVSKLLIEITKPKAPKTLFDTLRIGGDLNGINNVQIVGRRHTPVDKEQAIGRWKVIESELRARGLPVLN